MAAVLARAAAAAADDRGLRPWTRGETPALPGTDLGGRAVLLERYRGRVVLVAFWASWCEPCADELPRLATLRARLAGRPFDVVTVNFGEGPDRVREFLRAHEVDLPVVLDRDRRSAETWGVGGLPMTFLIGADGRVRSWVFGEVDFAGGALAAALEGLLRDAESGLRARGP